MRACKTGDQHHIQQDEDGVPIECLGTAALRNTTGVLSAGAFSCILIKTVFGIVTQTANQGINIAALRTRPWGHSLLPVRL